MSDLLPGVFAQRFQEKSGRRRAVHWTEVDDSVDNARARAIAMMSRELPARRGSFDRPLFVRHRWSASVEDSVQRLDEDRGYRRALFYKHYLPISARDPPTR
jgi:hypothetical protein